MEISSKLKKYYGRVSFARVTIFAAMSLSCVTSLGALFDNQGLHIPPEEESVIFGESLVDKTNLKVAQMSADNPFEWAHTIEFNTAMAAYPCTGGVVAFKGYRPSDKVIVLTAGHCVRTIEGGYLNPKTVLVNETLAPGQAHFSFPRPRTYLPSPLAKPTQQTSFNFSRIIFASFDFVDLALLEMELTYEQLDFRGFGKPPIISSRKPQLGIDTRAFGIPRSNRLASNLFHQSECKALEFSSYYSEPINIGQVLTFIKVDSILNNCTLLEGMSGGYVRNSSGEVIGVVGGGNIPGKNEKMYSYFNPVYPLAVCADEKGGVKEECLNEIASLIHNWKYEEFAKRFGSSFENK